LTYQTKKLPLSFASLAKHPRLQEFIPGINLNLGFVARLGR
jgi:hypothetical protein